MENQPDQQSLPYPQYSQYPQYPPPDPYAQAPAYPPQSSYPTPPTPSPYAPSPYPPQPGQPTYPPQPYPAPGQPYPYGSPSGPNYQQPRKPKNYLWLIIVVVVLVVLVGSLAVAVAQSGKGNGGNNQTASVPSTSVPTQAGQQATAAPTTAPTTVPTPASTPSSSTSGPHKIGDVVSIDSWQVSVLSAKISHGGPYDTLQHAGDVYLEIDVSVTNQTGQTQNFSSLLSFTLKDSTGQSYDSTFASDAPSSPDGPVTNGGKLRGTVVYEVPATMHTFEFDVAPDSLNSSDVAVWNLNV